MGVNLFDNAKLNYFMKTPCFVNMINIFLYNILTKRQIMILVHQY